MSESVFLADGSPARGQTDERFLPTELARGPWDPMALHGGAPAALMTAAMERFEPGSELRIGRLSFEFLRPIPMAPLSLEVELLRPGRRVQELGCALFAHRPGAEPELVCRGGALRVSPVPSGLPAAGEAPQASIRPLTEARPRTVGLDRSETVSFASSAIEMRWFEDPWALGPGQVWQRLRAPLLPDREPTPITRLAASADFGNGISASLPFDAFLFINADLHVHLHRAPRGEWIGLDARTVLAEDGAGLAESVLHDESGPVGRAFQTLVVQPR